MKRIAIVVAAVTGIVAVPTVLAAGDSGAGSSAGTDAYELAHTVRSPIGPLYGPVQAGPPSSSSYGYLTK